MPPEPEPFCAVCGFASTAFVWEIGTLGTINEYLCGVCMRWAAHTPWKLEHPYAA
jgi:hypothetical protein